MTHTVEDHDGLQVCVVTDMHRRYDEEGKLVSAKTVDNLKIVHASEIARYYNIPLRTIGRGDNMIPGIWAIVHDNEIGQRVAYNSEASRIGDRHVRSFKIIKDAAGNPMETVEKISNLKVHHKAGGEPADGRPPLVEETDDGMYVRLDDLLVYAQGQGWTKGGGRPGVVAPVALATSEAKLDKLTDLVQGLAQIMAQNLIAQHPPKK
jgi:hypothetical protein